MAIEQKIPVSGTAFGLRTFQQTTTSGVVQTEAVSIVDPDDTSLVASVNANGLKVDAFVSNFPAVQSVSVTPSGAFGYLSRTAVSVGSVSVVGRAVSMRIFPVGGDSSFNINGGDEITVRLNSGFDIGFSADLTNPVVNWMSGSFDLLVQLA